MVQSGRALEFRAGEILARVANGKIDLALDRRQDRRARRAWPLSPRCLQRQPDDLPTSVAFDVGWSGDATRARPIFSTSRSTRPIMRPGEEMKLKIASRFAGTATVAILSDSSNTAPSM